MFRLVLQQSPALRLSLALVLVVSFSHGCRSGLNGKRADAAGLGADTKVAVEDALQGENSDAPSSTERCNGVPIPDVHCTYATPTISCRNGEWVVTCPGPPATGGTSGVGTGGSSGMGGNGAGGTGGAQADCMNRAIAIANQIGLPGSCTAVVRLDYKSQKLLGHAFVCGKYQSSDEASVRKKASVEILYPYASPAGDGTLLSPSQPEDEWVLFTPASDFGGTTAISARTSLVAFAGTTVAMGTGSILSPSAWDTTDVGHGCPGHPNLPIRSYDLTNGTSFPTPTNVVEAVLTTAIPSALERMGGLFDGVVLLYPRTLEGFDPDTTEYIVLLNGGWLE
jgi:hypothetical protein